MTEEAKKRTQINKNSMKTAYLICKNVIEGKIVDLGGYASQVNNCLRSLLANKIINIDISKSKDVEIVQDLNNPIKMSDKSVDNIWSGNLIEHLECPLDFLKECKRILKDNGRIIIMTPNSLGLQEIWVAMGGEYAGAKVYNTKSWGASMNHHIYVWGKYNFSLLVEKAGLEILDFKYVSYYWNRNYLFKFLAWMFPIFRPSLFYVLTNRS